MSEVAPKVTQADLFEIPVATNDPLEGQPNYSQILLQSQQEMQAYLANTFAQNLQALHDFAPELFQRFQNYQAQVPLEFMCTSNCVPNLFLLKQNRFFYAAFDPMEYCDKQVALYLEHKRCLQAYYAEEKEQLGQIHFRYINELLRYQRSHLPDSVSLQQTQECPCAIVIGVGLGYHIAKLYESVNIGTLIINEPDPDLFYASLYAFDWANLLQFIHGDPQRDIKFFIGLKPEQFKEQLTQYYLDGRRVLSDFFWSMRHYHSPETMAHEKACMELFNHLNSSIGFFDSRLFALSQGCANIWQDSHFVKRLKFRGQLPEHVLKLNKLTSKLTLPQNITNTPICVVANGPSLSDDLPFLRQVQDHVLIIACGTALETLYNAGIQPHFYAAIERLKQIADVISLIPDTNYLKDIVLLSTDTIHPETAKLFKHQAIFFKPNEPMIDFLEYHRPEQAHDFEPIYCTNPLVGNMGLAAAATFGFKQIYMFGVDNGSARADKRQHPEESVTYSKIFSDTSHNVAAADQKVNELNIEMPGNFVEKVYTNLLYNTSAYTMEVLIENNQDLKFFNCSNGRKVAGATPVHSESLLQKWLTLPPVDLKSMHQFIENKLTCTVKLSKEESVAWCDKALFNHMALSCLKLLGVENAETQNLDPAKLPEETQGTGAANVDADANANTNAEANLKLEPLFDCKISQLASRLDYLQVLFGLCQYIQQIEQNPRTKKLASFFNGSVLNFCTLTMRAMYLSVSEQEALERAQLHLKNLAFFLDDARRLYVQFAPYYCEFQHRDCLKGKIGFDHEGAAAPEVPAYVPAVTQQDRDLYPVKVFTKRYS